MIVKQWLTGEDDLSAVRTLRMEPADDLDSRSLHVLVGEDDRMLATGRLYDIGGSFFIDMLAMTPDADPELLVLAVQLLVFKAGELGAEAVYSPVTGSLQKLLLAVGFLAVPPGEEPAATVVFRPGTGGHTCTGCGACSGHAPE